MYRNRGIVDVLPYMKIRFYWVWNTGYTTTQATTLFLFALFEIPNPIRPRTAKNG